MQLNDEDHGTSTRRRLYSQVDRRNLPRWSVLIRGAEHQNFYSISGIGTAVVVQLVRKPAYHAGGGGFETRRSRQMNRFLNLASAEDSNARCLSTTKMMRPEANAAEAARCRER